MELICLKNQNCNQKQKGVYEMKSKMKKTVAIIATVAAVLSFAAITVSAKTYTWTHTVSVASIPGFQVTQLSLMVTKYPITKQEPSMIVPVLVMDGNLLP